MKYLALTQGQFTIIDDDMYQFVMHWDWYAVKMTNGKFYACRAALIGGKYRRIYLHRFLLGVCDSKIFIDHKDGDTLNNTNKNIRIASNSENQKNKNGYGTSKYLGVTLDKRRNKYRVVINVNGKNIWIGSFDDETNAALAYNSAAAKYHGEFANPNIIS